MAYIVLFDGVCNLCNQSVQFIIKRDPERKFKFASLQSSTGEHLKEKYHLSNNIDSIVLIKDDQVFYQSTAALKISKELIKPYAFLYAAIVIPRPIRNKIYEWIAANRYKWFGKRDTCMLPNPKDKERFLD
ncbi:thiol-disulfide oxidoreductase DCC family protein [Saliterribacillus persicus]|uniref:Putative DCC family thiol-disulfide oxidoreductase YuxK n=1 Tax=Saliterribacillus persicus TaxID=930114 RepID=A0A368XTC0_9BACI|nr:thiol-disulfide oxidoreductase DCC family protein [Saliterribacillus persicus]RCW69757.1 putative DCC family thiol-disulfide oxidoreductase YuxK [Saliterribacillus persicus]